MKRRVRKKTRMSTGVRRRRPVLDIPRSESQQEEPSSSPESSPPQQDNSPELHQQDLKDEPICVIDSSHTLTRDEKFEWEWE
ncbi:Hypothetical predicted protein [Cloeon dipterum]|uniref:Uncharacterized protein n=1 Tax=Cloeon dipterum TaxID=197152 RepID=A0A8S1CBW5_9INSE|nr:Hypothetical predicted protein [Cloeon dipterum]